jgi:hypothetical protein
VEDAEEPADESLLFAVAKRFLRPRNMFVVVVVVVVGSAGVRSK